MSTTDELPSSSSNEWQASNLFATPDSSEDWLSQVEQLNGRERYIATLYGMMMWNLCCKMHNSVLTTGDTQDAHPE